MRILFLVKNRGTYGLNGRFGLFNSASMIVRAISSEHIHCKLVSVVDGNSLDKELFEYRPKIAIIEAIYVTPAKMEELVKLHPKVKFVIRVHSAGNFLASDGMALTWINEYINIPNVTVSFNNLKFNNELKQLGYNTLYLPNIYLPESTFDRCHSRYQDRILSVGLFGALRIMKGHFQQAIAAMLFADKIGKKLHLHININNDSGHENVLKNIRALFANNPRHKLVEHNWMSHKDFCQLVSEMDINMCVSLSETFCIVAADGVFQDVPTIGCKDINFLHPLFQCEPNTKSIMRGLYTAYYGSAINLQYLNKMKLVGHNVIAKRIWLDYVKSQK